MPQRRLQQGCLVNQGGVENHVRAVLEGEDVVFLPPPDGGQDCIRLLNGETVEIPTYNFKKGAREYNGNFMRLSEGDSSATLEAFRASERRVDS